MNLKTLLDQHKREVAHCAFGYANAQTNKESRRWLYRLKLHSRTVTALEATIEAIRSGKSL